MNPASNFRILSLSTVDAELRPQSRMVVLRDVDVTRRLLIIYTDLRSPKWTELTANPKASVLAYCPKTRQQLRLSGMVELHEAGSSIAESCWQSLSKWARTTYQGGPPGDPLDAVPEIEPETKDAGYEVFGVIAFRAAQLDHFTLKRGDNRRAHYLYAPKGNVLTSQWISP